MPGKLVVIRAERQRVARCSDDATRCMILGAPRNATAWAHAIPRVQRLFWKKTPRRDITYILETLLDSSCTPPKHLFHLSGTRHNGPYPIQHAMRAAVPAIPININPAPGPHIVPAIPIPQYTPTRTTLPNTLGHISNRREKQLDPGNHNPWEEQLPALYASQQRLDEPLVPFPPIS